MGKLNRAIAAAVLAAGMAAPALGQWQLVGEESAVNFISVKNAAIAETHSFKQLEGAIDGQGAVRVSIALASVDTLIPIRDERMRELLFETARFPLARVAAQLDPALLARLRQGGSFAAELPLSLALHGREQELLAPLIVFSEGDSLRVVSARPLLLNAADFALADGVEALRAVAGLANISTAVPVTLDLRFRAGD